jgi:hypothetical protein
MVIRSVAPLIAAMIAAFPLAAGAQAPARPNAGFPAGMAVKDRIEILQAAGFTASANGQNVSISCGEKEVPNRPGVGLVDLTGDGKPEFVVLGQRACPGETAPPIQVDIVMRRTDGIWQNILSARGTIKPAEGATAGWRNLTVVNGTKISAFVHDAAADRYANVSDLQARKNIALAIRPTKYPPGTLPTAGWAMPMAVGSLTPGDIAAIFTAAGYKRVGAGWKGCGGTSDAGLFEEDQLGPDQSSIADLNGDGQPEVMVYDASTECYGNTGTAFTILSPVPGGWKVVFRDGAGMPGILDTRSRTGWRDVVTGGPGFCHEAYRNDGKGYAAFRQVAEMPGACSR